MAVASAAVLIGGTAGMATAAQHSLPGEALYPVKRGIEKAELGLSMSSAGRGRDLLHQASDRLDEAQGLVDQGSATGTPRVPDTVAAFTASARDGRHLRPDVLLRALLGWVGGEGAIDEVDDRDQERPVGRHGAGP